MKTTMKMLIVFILLAATPLLAETIPEIDTEKLFAEKRALIEDAMQFSDKESAVFWPLYYEYEKNEKNIFKKRVAHLRKYLKKRETLSDKQAKSLMNEYLDLEAEALKYKREFVQKLNEKLPPKRGYKLFQLEEIIEAGFFCEIADNLPLAK